ncbi:MAG: DUF4954 family protein [Spirochaetes bacterium]|nr:DUF4954 family protein [Spirochaetota bacterium]
MKMEAGGVSSFDGLLETSEFIDSVRRYKDTKAKSTLFGNEVRMLTPEEIETLVSQHNLCDSWDRVLVAREFTPQFIRQCTFFGDCVLGVFDGGTVHLANGIRMPNGLYRSTLVESEAGDNSLVFDAGVVSNYRIGARSVVFRVGALQAAGECSFGNGTEVSLGIETGGREVKTFAEIAVGIAWEVATKRSDTALLKRYAGFVDAYRDEVTLPYGVVDEDAVVCFVSRVTDTWVGRGVTVDGACVVQDSTLLGDGREAAAVRDGACVRRSCVQWGCEVDSMAFVQDSVLAEHSRVERHGKVIASIVGPNTTVAEGEITSSLVGPFVGFHHQALLIAALWPEGKGNVGYGANVGSNHTSKSPDQELFCGEGVFFGLGSNVKYPANFLDAPYTIIATAVSTLPQRVEFPFSLINSPAEAIGGISPSFNEIFPGWVLRHNIYMVRRNEVKYRKRNRATKSGFVFEVFRRDIVERMLAARQRLLGVKKKSAFYTEQQIEGIGKNFLKEEQRTAGIESYTFYIRYYILSGIKKTAASLLHEGRPDALSRLYEYENDDDEWKYQKTLLDIENLRGRDPVENLEELCRLQGEIARSTEESKNRDDRRGRHILGEYYDAHIEASDDPFVRETWEEKERLDREVEALVLAISKL